MIMEQPIGTLKKAERIPQGTTYVASMGDGSGTALVSQELLEKEVEEKVSVDVLDTQEEIEANTEEGKATGALAVKEMVGALNDNLGVVTEYTYGSDTVSFTEWAQKDFTLGKPAKGTYLVIPKITVSNQNISPYDASLRIGESIICRNYNLAGTAKMPSGIFTTNGTENLTLRVFSKTTVSIVAFNGAYNVIKIHS